MAENWIQHCVDFLKYFETDSSQCQIHQFRRSFQGGNKKERLLPQLECMYEKAKLHLADSPEILQAWFNQESFRLTLGRKSAPLKSTASATEFKHRLLQLCSKWDPELYTEPTVQASPNNFGISRKQMRTAMRRMHQMDDRRLANVLKSVPADSDIDTDQLNTVFDDRSSSRIQSLLNR